MADATKLCTLCGKTGHRASKCPIKPREWAISPTITIIPPTPTQPAVKRQEVKRLIPVETRRRMPWRTVTTTTYIAV